jgi:hypothetical protein
MYHGAASCYHLEQRASKRFLSFDAWRHLRAYVRWLGKWGLQRSAISRQLSAAAVPAESR